MRIVVAVSAAMLVVPGGVEARGRQEAEGKPAAVVEVAHVRALDPLLRRLIERGIAGSATFRRLVADLNASDVIVHVERGRIRNGLRGYLLHRVVESNGFRYLRISVDTRLPEPLVIAIIAHELQHALEVARAPAVGRSLEIEAFFATIADHGCATAYCFETSAAVNVQQAVLSEVK